MERGVNLRDKSHRAINIILLVIYAGLAQSEKRRIDRWDDEWNTLIVLFPIPSAIVQLRRNE